MFDRSLIQEADFEFVLLADTHYMNPEVESVEFESRQTQSKRTGRALSLVEALDPAFVVHLGDLVQSFPGSPDFDTAMAEAVNQLDRLELDVHHVAGNHDVGDKPDPTMPTQPVTRSSLEAYHDRFGPSWYSWDHGGVHFVVLNSQIMNSSLEAAFEQRTWLEEDLRTAGSPVLAFLHLPPFLHQPDEPALGHYDNVGKPAREWLLGLFHEHSVSHLFAGHCHFEFRNRVGPTQIHVVPSPSFTRPGFGELFSSCPPPERGRDDRAKLGFYLVRVIDHEPHLHFVRTSGESNSSRRGSGRRLLTRPIHEASLSPLGVSLLRPVTDTVVVPEAFPSAIRQEVHNDYPGLGIREIGFGCVRTSIRELDDDFARQMLRELKRAGVTLVGTIEVSSERDLELANDVFDEVEVRLLGGPLPSPDEIERLEAYRRRHDRVNLSTVVPDRSDPEKQHDRLRGAYRPTELETVDAHLADQGVNVDRVLCWIGSSVDPWRRVHDEPEIDSLTNIGAVDWLVPITGMDEGAAVDHVCRATFASALEPHSRLYLEPLRALDRTMDPATGLLDRRCNPTAAFSAVRCLNAVLFGDGHHWAPGPEHDLDAARYLVLEGTDRDVGLALPQLEEVVHIDIPSARRPVGRRRTVSVSDGYSRQILPQEDSTAEISLAGPTIVIDDLRDDVTS